MSNSTEEIDIWKRLAALEEAVSEFRGEIEELKRNNLGIAKVLGDAICTTIYQVGLLTFKGEDLDSFTKLWKKKLEDTRKEIGDSPTVKRALETSLKFEEELRDYIRATKVATADKAMEIAHSFIKKYSPVALPMKAEREGDVWLVDIDVGALAVKVAKVKLDARTGDILSYEIPPK